MSDNYPLLKRSTNKRVLNIILKNSKNDLEIKIIHDILDIAYQNNVFFACYKDDFDNINDPNGPYYDHKLTDEPWIGFNEYHILNDLLVVYYKVDSKKTIRFTTITTHDELRKGKLK